MLPFPGRCWEEDDSCCPGIHPVYSVNLGYVSLSLILLLFYCWFCCSTSVHRPESFIPEESAVVAVVKSSFYSHLTYPKKAVYSNRDNSIIPMVSSLLPENNPRLIRDLTDAELEISILAKCWTLLAPDPFAVLVPHSLWPPHKPLLGEEFNFPFSHSRHLLLSPAQPGEDI